jgi:hypothetical protein
MRKIRRFVDICRAKGRRYWIFAVLFACMGAWVSRKLDATQFWLDFRYRPYVAIQDMRGGAVRVPQMTMVEIGDKEYYSEELAARKPLNRRYLATLVRRLAEAKTLINRD